MVVDKMPVYQLLIDEMSFDKIVFLKMAVDKSASWSNELFTKGLVDKMVYGKMTVWPNYLAPKSAQLLWYGFN